MSIINDALKKTQMNLQKKKSQKNAPQSSPTTPSTPQESWVSPTPAPAQQEAYTSYNQSKGTFSPDPGIQLESAKSRKKRPLGMILLWSLAFGLLLSTVSLKYSQNIPILLKLPKLPGIGSQASSLITPRKTIIRKTAPSAITITGIMSMGDRNVVLINDEIYEKGEHIGEKEIVEISLDYIVVSRDGQQERIAVNKKR